MRVTTFFLLLFLGLQCLNAQDRLSGKSFATRSEVLATNGMAATNHPIATQIAIEILKDGGSAIDGAIAANAFLGLADPGMNGIGGDLFAIVWDASAKRLWGINASGKSPQDLTYDYLLNKLKPNDNQLETQLYSLHRGVNTVTVPGCVDGWFALHQKFGNLPVADLLQPTIDYAREGIPITSEVADNFKVIEARIQQSDNPTFKKLYFTEDNRFPRKGEIFRNPALANTLEQIAEKGRDAFYEGKIAQGIADHIQSHGGFLSVEDLAAHQSKFVDPVSVNYRGYDVWEMPPNGQGVAALQILNILEGFDLKSMGFGSDEYLHHFTEAKKLAFEDLTKYYGDPEFSQIPLQALLSKEYAVKRRKLIKEDQAGIFEAGQPAGDHTIYLTVADQEGNMISLIQSNSSLFGSYEVPDGLGFALQNRGGGFVLKKGHINQYQPGKRPYHTIIPGFVTQDGKPYLSFGVMGGSMQPQGHAQVLINLIDFGMNLQEAGDAPRIRHRSSSGEVGITYVESGLPYETLSGLMDRGHQLRLSKGIFGGYQAIMLKDGVYYGASESRKDGQAAGY